MNEKQWEIFCDFKNALADKCREWTEFAPELQELQKQAAVAAKNPLYSFETPVVYNRDLDKITKDDNIKLIVIGDNPGKDEQLEKNNRYLVGQAGKLADGFFKRHPELGVDFRKNVIILNKTPIHSAKTNQLKTMVKLGGQKISDLLKETQCWMAAATAKLHQDLWGAADENSGAPEIWLVGYSELKAKGIFELYRNELKKAYDQNQKAWENVYVFQHFSMNRFTYDLGEYCKKNGECSQQSLLTNIHQIGNLHKEEIFNN